VAGGDPTNSRPSTLACAWSSTCRFSVSHDEFLRPGREVGCPGRRRGRSGGMGRRRSERTRGACSRGESRSRPSRYPSLGDAMAHSKPVMTHAPGQVRLPARPWRRAPRERCRPTKTSAYHFAPWRSSGPVAPDPSLARRISLRWLRPATCPRCRHRLGAACFGWAKQIGGVFVIFG